MALHDLQDEARPAGKWDPVHKVSGEPSNPNPNGLTPTLTVEP